jgi:hypothetical protein
MSTFLPVGDVADKLAGDRALDSLGVQVHTYTSTGIEILLPDPCAVTAAQFNAAYAPAEKQELISYTDRKTVEVETGGIEFGTPPIAIETAVGDQIYLTQLYLAAKEDPAGSYMYEGVARSAQEITDIYLAASEHIQRCEEVESDCVAKINAGTITTTQQIDSAFEAMLGMHNVKRLDPRKHNRSKGPMQS